jgi:zinc transport system substrate-binding protein
LADCERTTVVVSHDAFGYLDRYGLEFEPIEGLSPGAEPTPADLARLQQLITEDGITTVFSERLASSKMADSLAGDLGLETAVLDPVEGLSDETSEDDYLSLMGQNLDALRKANGCQ